MAQSTQTVPNQRARTCRGSRQLTVVVATVLILTAVFAGGLYLIETVNADREVVQRVKNGMTCPDVVELLGVMYDRSYRGEYDSTDKIIAGMENSESISYVCIWRIGFSRDKFCVGFDEHDVAVSTMD